MSRSRGLGLFAGFGVELEYMIVDRETLTFEGHELLDELRDVRNAQDSILAITLEAAQ